MIFFFFKQNTTKPNTPEHRYRRIHRISQGHLLEKFFKRGGEAKSVFLGGCILDLQDLLCNPWQIRTLAYSLLTFPIYLRVGAQLMERLVLSPLFCGGLADLFGNTHSHTRSKTTCREIVSSVGGFSLKAHPLPACTEVSLREFRGAYFLLPPPRHT